MKVKLRTFVATGVSGCTHSVVGTCLAVKHMDYTAKGLLVRSWSQQTVTNPWPISIFISMFSWPIFDQFHTKWGHLLTTAWLTNFTKSLTNPWHRNRTLTNSWPIFVRDQLVTISNAPLCGHIVTKMWPTPKQCSWPSHNQLVTNFWPALVTNSWLTQGCYSDEYLLVNNCYFYVTNLDEVADFKYELAKVSRN